MPIYYLGGWLVAVFFKGEVSLSRRMQAWSIILLTNSFKNIAFTYESINNSSASFICKFWLYPSKLNPSKESSSLSYSDYTYKSDRINILLSPFTPVNSVYYRQNTKSFLKLCICIFRYLNSIRYCLFFKKVLNIGPRQLS